MASTYSKFLWSVTIDADNNTLDTSLGTATIDSGDYDSILEVLANLEDKLQAVDAGFSVSLSSVGKVSLFCASNWTWTTATTDDNLSTLLGLDEAADSVSSKYLTASNQHTHGYYPGCLSFGYATNKGTGIVADGRWVPVFEGNRLFAGTGASSALYPANPIVQKDITLSPIYKDEIDDTTIGTYGFLVSNVASTFRWYPDRTDGIVNTPGTQNTDYYLCSFTQDPEWKKSGRNPDYFSLQLGLNKEPA